MNTSHYPQRSGTYRAIIVALFLTFSFFLFPSANLPTDARALNCSRVPFLFATDNPKAVPLVEQVGAIGMTVSDMDASIEFYSKVLSFEKVSDVEVTGEDYERFQGVFGLRMRVVRMRLGDEFIDLTEYLAPKGRPVPVDSRSRRYQSFLLSRS